LEKEDVLDLSNVSWADEVVGEISRERCIGGGKTNVKEREIFAVANAFLYHAAVALPTFLPTFQASALSWHTT
jgi:hypothetical protein